MYVEGWEKKYNKTWDNNKRGKETRKYKQRRTQERKKVRDWDDNGDEIESENEVYRVASRAVDGGDNLRIWKVAATISTME
jgi:hypothetical protein